MSSCAKLELQLKLLNVCLVSVFLSQVEHIKTLLSIQYFRTSPFFYQGQSLVSLSEKQISEVLLSFCIRALLSSAIKLGAKSADLQSPSSKSMSESGWVKLVREKTCAYEIKKKSMRLRTFLFLIP